MKVERTQGLAWRKVGDEMVVIHLARHRIFGLNGRGGRIWEALQEAQDIENLNAIAAEDEDKGVEVIDAVSRFVSDLAEEDLVDFDGDLPKVEDQDNVVDFPRIEWREDLQQFAGMCQLVPGQHPSCNQNPGGS